MKFTTLLLLFVTIPNLLFAQSKKKARDSKHIHINALIDYQSVQPELRLTFAVDRLLGELEATGVSIRLKMEPLGSSQVLLDTTLTQLEDLEKINNYFVLKYRLPAAKERRFLSVYVEDQIQQEGKSQDLYVVPPFHQLDFAWENLTQKEHDHLPTVLDSLRFTSSSHQHLWVYHFKPNFFPAAPPFQRKVASGSKSMEVDTLFRVPVNETVNFQQEGLYFIQADTTGNAGLGLRVVPKDFPIFTQVDHIANALIYITTLDDIAAMLATSNQKQTLDEFWLERGGSEVNARRLIKFYYQRVAYANAHFSSHKLGWKTDKGMIYIVFGQPDEVVKGEDYEIWKYSGQKSGSERVEFEFVHKPSLFSHNHYQLRRSNDLKGFWYSKVKQWRKGTIVD